MCALFRCSQNHQVTRKPVTWSECWPLAGIPLDELKAMWDGDDGTSCDEVHAELNRRGEGSYCPI